MRRRTTLVIAAAALAAATGLARAAEPDARSLLTIYNQNLALWTSWRIAVASDPNLKTDAQTIEFRVRVPADGEKVVTYRAHYSW